MKFESYFIWGGIPMIPWCGNRIPILYLEKHMKKEQLADLLGIPPEELDGYEDGTAVPGDAAAFKIAEYFHVSLDYLAGRTAERGGIGMEDTLLDPVDQQALVRLFLKMVRNYFTQAV